MTVTGPVVGQRTLLSGGFDVFQAGRDPAAIVPATLGLGYGDGRLQDVESLSRVAAGQAYQVVEGLLAQRHPSLRSQRAGEAAGLCKECR